MAQKKTTRKTAKTTAATKKTVSKKASVKKATKKAAAKKAVSKKAAAGKKTSAKKTPAKSKTASKKKTAAKKTTSGKSSGSSSKRKLSSREEKFLKIRQLLLDQKDALLSEAESAMNVLPEQTVFPDLGDQATAETDRNFMLRLRGREQRLLNKIEEAIERIDSNTFGVCESCGEDIGIQRLVARPVTNLCIDCKEEQEEEEKLQAT